MAVYACADLHGMYNLYEKICAKLKPEDKVIFLGDAGDRGPEGWKLIKTILANPQWTYLKGNHEDMLIKAIHEACESLEGANGPAVELSIWNGGQKTIKECLEDPDGLDVIQQLENLDCFTKYVSPSGVTYWCTHAGYSIREGLDPRGRISERDLIWDREHLYQWMHIDNIKDNFLIHGHTPIQFSDEYMCDGGFMGEPFHSPYLYCNNMKIDIDAGAFYSQETFLFNMDEFNFEVIKED